jgi:hypothetical protein
MENKKKIDGNESEHSTKLCEWQRGMKEVGKEGIGRAERSLCDDVVPGPRTARTAPHAPIPGPSDKLGISVQLRNRTIISVS